MENGEWSNLVVAVKFLFLFRYGIVVWYTWFKGKSLDALRYSTGTNQPAMGATECAGYSWVLRTVSISIFAKL